MLAGMQSGLIILTGPPGAGKSTIARLLVAVVAEQTVLLEADSFFHCVRNGYVLPWLPEAHEQNRIVTRAVGAAAARFVTGGYTIVLDGIIGPWFLEELLNEVPVSYPVHYVILRPSLDEASRRATARRAPGALLDQEPITHMYRSFVDLGEFENYVLDTFGKSAAETAELVQSVAESGALRLR
jgi:energy-coupling factor transporter ATP-binding protein EcfA2